MTYRMTKLISKDGGIKVNDKVAIVTGGSSGIGAATVRLFAERGYRVAAIGRNEQRLNEVATSSERIVPIIADLSSPQTARDTVARIGEQLGRIDVLVNAHGVLGDPAEFQDFSEEVWDLFINTNLRAPIATAAAAVPYLKESKGSVVNVSSINAIQAEPQNAPYGVTKAALSGFTKYAAADMAPYGIRVNAVLPGWVRTPMAIPFLEEAGVLDKPVSFNYMQRPGQPQEIAKVIAFLASEEASFMTGECLVADGGHWINMREIAAAE